MSRSDNFALYAAYYNLLYADKDYAAEANYVSELLLTYGKNVKTILEFGSGTGRHGKLLQEMGYFVQGIERSEMMIEIARAGGFTCTKADISEYYSDQKYDSVISLFHVISYLNENDKLIATFENAAKHLSDGGLFVFDVWYSPAVFTSKAETRVRRIESAEMEIIRIAEPKTLVNKNVIEVNFNILVKNHENQIINELNEIHPMRHFTIPEIELLAKLTGFEVICAQSFLDGGEPSEHTWGVCFVLRKI